MHQQHHPEDKKAAFTGLIVTALVILVSMYGMVQWTNARFEAHAATPGAVAH